MTEDEVMIESAVLRQILPEVTGAWELVHFCLLMAMGLGSALDTSEPGSSHPTGRGFFLLFFGCAELSLLYMSFL